MRKNKKSWIGSDGKKHWIYNGKRYTSKKKRKYVKFGGQKYYIKQDDYENLSHKDYQELIKIDSNIQTDFIEKYVHSNEEFDEFPEL